MRFYTTGNTNQPTHLHPDTEAESAEQLAIAELKRSGLAEEGAVYLLVEGTRRSITGAATIVQVNFGMAIARIDGQALVVAEDFDPEDLDATPFVATMEIWVENGELLSRMVPAA